MGDVGPATGGTESYCPQTSPLPSGWDQPPEEHKSTAASDEQSPWIRAEMERDYAERLRKASERLLGPGEIGQVRSAPDVIRQETERQANEHLALSNAIRENLEIPVTLARQRQEMEVEIEEAFEQKQREEAKLADTKWAYDQACEAANTYAYQKRYLYGQELRDNGPRLEEVQALANARMADYQVDTRAFVDTVAQWDLVWTGFCNVCQDIEEERLEFVKDGISTYTQAMSTCSASGQKSSLTIQFQLAAFEVPQEMGYLILIYGTGPLIPEAPPSVYYNAAHLTQPAPSTRISQYARKTTRVQSYAANLAKHTKLYALANYTATTDTEFDFFEGDIIGVIARPEDGWWHGYRCNANGQPGRTLFPSNFTAAVL